MTNQHSAILSACAGPVALFLDFDGTLVEIAPRPDAIEIPSTLIDRLSALSDTLDGALALVSGRAIADIDGFLDTPTLTISGSHGSERRHRGTSLSPAAKIAESALQIGARMVDRFGDDERIIVELKPTGVAVHFRSAPDREEEVMASFIELIAEHSDFVAISGKAVIEAKPVAANKGTAILSLLNEEPFRGRVPVFIGDDVTDEDGFKVVNAVGGVSIKISPGATIARFRLDDVADVHRLLDQLTHQQQTIKQQIRHKETVQ